MSNAYVPLLPDSNTGHAQAMVDTLEAFDVPFIWYEESSRVARVSKSAQAVLAQALDPHRALVEITQAVAAALTRPFDAAAAPRGFQSLGELPSLRGIGTVSLHRPPAPVPGVAAVVVLSVGARDSGEFMSRLLTRRELEVARLVATGAANKEVAARLGISTHTARHHTERVYRKLSIKSRVSLVRMVTERAATQTGARGFPLQTREITRISR